MNEWAGEKGELDWGRQKNEEAIFWRRGTRAARGMNISRNLPYLPAVHSVLLSDLLPSSLSPSHKHNP